MSVLRCETEKMLKSVLNVLSMKDGDTTVPTDRIASSQVCRGEKKGRPFWASCFFVAFCNISTIQEAGGGGLFI